MPVFNLTEQKTIYSESDVRVERKKRAKKVLPTTLKELTRLDLEQVAFNRELWLSQVRYITDCFFDGEEAIIRVIDVIALNSYCAEYVISKGKLETSRLVIKIEEEFRVKINIEDFYEHNRPKKIESLYRSSTKTEFDWREFRKQEVDLIKRSQVEPTDPEGDSSKEHCARGTFLL